jgi:23S rRNA (pseudouridine1915-N3)-methyltransferase
VKLKIAWIGKTKDASIRVLTDDYLKRIARYTDVEGLALPDEAALLKLGEKSGTRPPHVIALFDSLGKQLSSVEFANFLQTHQETNPLPLVLAIGPADGFSPETRKAVSRGISFGRMTFAHELARVVLLEQVYRAFTILKGHPYHTGH